MAKKTTKKKMSIAYSAHLSNIVEFNESFDLGYMRVAYHGINRNGSKITKSDFEANLSTLAYVPVVCNYSVKEDSIGSHDSERVKTKNGKAVDVVMTMPIGVVPENFKWDWEEVEEKDGTMHEYLCCEVLLWKRQPAYEHIKKEEIIDQSMEISVTDGDFDEDGYFTITKFMFTALCLLESAEPCFESASLHTYSIDESKQQLLDMYEDVKKIQGYNSSLEDDINKNAKKEVYSLDKLELIKEYGFELETIGFSIEELEYEQLKEKLEELKAACNKKDEEEDFKSAEDDSEDDLEDGEDLDDLEDEDFSKEDKFALSCSTMGALCEAVKHERFEAEWGMTNRYYVIDFDQDITEVYLCDKKEDYNTFGCKYSLDGDTAIIDFSTKVRKKSVFVDFVEGTHMEPTKDHREEFCLEKANFELSENEKKFSEQIKEQSATIETLELYKVKVEKYESAELKEAKLQKFNDAAYAKLVDTDLFKEIKKDIDLFSVEELENKLDLALAKYAKENKMFAIEEEQKPGKVGISHEKAKVNAYGNLLDNVKKKSK